MKHIFRDAIRTGGKHMQGSYEIITLKDAKADGDSIYSTLQKMQSGELNNDLKLLNYYDELPISYGNIIVEECEGGLLELTVHQNQAVVIEDQKQTLIKSSYFPVGFSVHCIAERASSRKCYVALGRFAYAQVRAERRAAIRVRMAEPVFATINSGTKTCCKGRVIDLSISGIKVLNVEPQVEETSSFSISMQILGQQMSIPASLLREKTNEKGSFIVFTIQPDSLAEGKISKLIYNRQVEIIQTIKARIGDD